MPSNESLVIVDKILNDHLNEITDALAQLVDGNPLENVGLNDLIEVAREELNREREEATECGSKYS